MNSGVCLTSQALLEKVQGLQNLLNQRLVGLDWLSYYLEFKRLLENLVNDPKSRQLIDSLSHQTLDLIDQILEHPSAPDENIILTSVQLQMIAVDIKKASINESDLK